jgi:hypothetical protein
LGTYAPLIPVFSLSHFLTPLPLGNLGMCMRAFHDEIFTFSLSHFLNPLLLWGLGDVHVDNAIEFSLSHFLTFSLSPLRLGGLGRRTE